MDSLLDMRLRVLVSTASRTMLARRCKSDDALKVGLSLGNTRGGSIQLGCNLNTLECNWGVPRLGDSTATTARRPRLSRDSRPRSKQSTAKRNSFHAHPPPPRQTPNRARLSPKVVRRRPLRQAVTPQLPRPSTRSTL